MSPAATTVLLVVMITLTVLALLGLLVAERCGWMENTGDGEFHLGPKTRLRREVTAGRRQLTDENLAAFFSDRS